MGFSSLRATENEIDSLGRLLTTLWLWTWETTVTRSDAPEATLTPLELGSTSLLDALNGVLGVATGCRTVSLNLARHLDHTFPSVAFRRPSAPI